MRIGTRLLALGVLSLAACAAENAKEPTAPAPALVGAPAVQEPGPGVGTANKSAPNESMALDKEPAKAEAGQGAKEAFDGPPSLPTALPPGMPPIPGLPPIPGAPPGTGTI